MKIMINGIQSNLRFSSAHVIPVMNLAVISMDILILLMWKIEGGTLQENLNL